MANTFYVKLNLQESKGKINDRALGKHLTNVNNYAHMYRGNSMASSVIWNKHAQVSFSKVIKIARVRRTSTISSL